MSIKLANNAMGRLAATLNTTDTSIVLNSADVANFPALSSGEWHPMTIVSAAGDVEVVKVTARSVNVLTAVRAQEGTAAASFSAGDRAEIRMTAVVVATLQTDTAAVGPAAVVAMDAKDAALSSTLTALMDSKDSALATTLRGEIASAVSAGFPVGFGPVPWSRPSLPAGWAWADGSTLTSGTAYPALRSAYIADGFPFGQDGSGNPKLPDMRGAVPAGLDNLGGVAAGRLAGAAALGALLGSQTHALTSAQMPVHNHSATTGAAGAHTHTGSTNAISDHDHAGSSTDTEPAHTHSATAYGTGSGGVIGNGATAVQNTARATTAAGAHSHALTLIPAGAHSHTLSIASDADHTHTVSVTSAGNGDAHPNVQPSLVVGYIIKA